MKKEYLFVFIVFFAFFSCKNGKKETETLETQIPVIDIEKALDNPSSQKLNLSEFVDDIKYIPLQTISQSVIGGKHIPPVFVSENFIFYGDMMFDRNGRFIRKLGKIGQGPEEYLMALGITADEERQEFYVHDNFSRNIYIYDFNNTFKKKIQASDRGNNILSFGNGNILLIRDFFGYFDDFYEYRVINTNTGEIVYTRDSGIMGNKYLSNIQNLIWRYNTQTFYYEGSTDSIFRLKENGAIDTPRFIINLGKYKNSDSEKFIRVGEIVENSQYLFFSISAKNGLFYGAYEKQTEKTVMKKFDEFFNNDIDGGFLWLFKDTYDGREGFYSIFPYLAKERIEMLSKQNTGYDKEKNQKLRQLINNVEEDDNQIFYFFKLK